jgi:hypothetical protein
MFARSDWVTSGSQSPVLAILVTIGIHLLIMIYWKMNGGRWLPAVALSETRTVITFIEPAKPRPVPPRISTPMQREVVTAKPPRVRPLTSPDRPLAAPEAISTTTAPATDPVPAPAINAADMLAQARRDVGKIDHELRGTGPLLSPNKPDSKQARLEQAMSEAFIDRSPAVLMDRYVAPDGVAITRVTTGARSKCYMSGTVNFVPGVVPGALHDSSRPKSVSCPPADAGWSRL